MAGQVRRGIPWRFVAFGAAFLVAIDSVLDPAIVHAGLWVWKAEGAYYGVPLVNFLGWAVTGSAYTALFLLAVRGPLRSRGTVPISIASSLMLILPSGQDTSFVKCSSCLDVWGSRSRLSWG